VRFRIPAVGERVSERRALVTGGAGFIGSHLVEGLVAHGWRVRVLDDLSTGREAHVAAVAGEVELVQGDVRDAECVARAVDDVEVVFHLAAMASVPRSVEDPVTTHSVNALGTKVERTHRSQQACLKLQGLESRQLRSYGGGGGQPVSLEISGLRPCFDAGFR
jgi:UDP-glucose 4-epimerase